MSEHVEQVLDELDPTPANEAAWPVSRRQTLRALASVGALAAVSGASAQSAGTVIADEAFLSNYGSEATASGYEMTIDGDTFSFDGDETVGLPGGSEASTVTMPDGTEASEIIGPDGDVVYSAAAVIPDSGLVHDYSANNTDASADGETASTIFDQEGSADLTGGSATRTDAGINGGTSLLFNDDKYDVDFADLSQPISVYHVLEWDGTTGANRIHDGLNNGRLIKLRAGDAADYEIFAGTVLVGGSGAPLDTPIVVEGYYDGIDSELYENDTQELAGDAGSGGFEGITLGQTRGNNTPFGGLWSRTLIYQNQPSDDRPQTRQALIDIYGTE